MEKQKIPIPSKEFRDLFVYWWLRGVESPLNVFPPNVKFSNIFWRRNYSNRSSRHIVFWTTQEWVFLFIP